MEQTINNDSVRFPYKHGYHVAMLDIRMDLIDKVKKFAKSLTNWFEIFNYFENEGTKAVGDRKRFQVTIENTDCNETMKSFFSCVKETVRVYDPKWIIENPVFLHSLPGGKRQIEHSDFSEEYIGLAPEDHFFAGLLISLEDETPFYIDNKTIHLRKGEFCLFKGDVVHAGASFKKDNFRFHCKLGFESVQSPLQPNDDAVEAFSQYVCKYCNERFFDKKRKSNHQILCKKNPKGEERRAKVYVQRKVKVKCPYCDYVVDKRNISRHTKKCLKNPSNNPSNKGLRRSKRVRS